jgi:predicted phosphodiesterase
MVDVRGLTIGILPLNSALFCQGDDDHEKLWIGRRCLAAALDKLQALGAQINVALVHHPLEWLESQERANIRAELHAKVDFILRGHLHETDVESVVGASGAALHVAAGAAYQTRRWPNRALYATIEVDRLTVFPIRYADQPRDVWTVDPSLFPSEANYEKSFSIARLAWSEQEPRPAPPEMAPAWASLPRFQSNIPSRRNLPFVGRESGDTPNESTSSVERDQIFISYSHKDVKWLERIQVHLKSLERLGTVKRWDDTMIKPGTKWREEIRRALESAKVAVLLISADFLASEFIITNELPLLLAAAAKRGVVILPIIVNPCRFEQTKILSEFQAVNPPTRPLGMMNRSRQEAVFVAMTRAIEDALQS